MVVPRHDVGEVRIGVRRQLGERASRARQQPVAHGPLYVREEGGIAPHPSHHRAAEEEAEEQPPAPRVPLAGVEGGLLRGRPALPQPLDAPARVHQRQDAPSKGAQVPLEPPRVDDPPGHDLRLRIPERPGPVRKLTAQPAVRLRAPCILRHAQKREQPGVLQPPERRYPQLHARELRRAQIRRHHLRRIERQERQRVVPRRRDRQQPPAARRRRQRVAEHVRILPHARVADEPERRALVDRPAHGHRNGAVPRNQHAFRITPPPRSSAASPPSRPSPPPRRRAAPPSAPGWRRCRGAPARAPRWRSG